ncbi:hypothetical protein [Mesorhizobium retamae]|uniref:Uncharacterized protein n=1 Tax=Mesorhizobium retamae TaxID=2912854 RepID=A0ABS9QCR6_9HYPH|nr:hypothetical protein [Mesorhizobium sp. IRAMC:0171]MCG7505220.1 hypothetical protein [Mesorhizobium sp. IRAMC:0171]
MKLNAKLLAIIGKRIPAIYDVIPRGPQGWISQVALNPQPLPPGHLGAALATDFIRSAWLADRGSLDLKQVFDDLDDWCPTRPKKIKLPPWWPPIPEPEPHPEWFVEFHLGFAARLAVSVWELGDTSLAQSLNKAMERSLTVIETTNY